jgi:hypothetical protein
LRPEEDKQALIFMESADDSVFGSNPNTDILRYMFNTGASSWYGFQGGSGVNGTNVADLKIYMDWPGFVNGTANVPPVIKVPVPQVTGGSDSQGNPIDAFVFETAEIIANTTTGNVWYSIWVPHSLLDSSSLVYGDVQFNFAGAPNSLSPLTTDSTLRRFDITYTGSNWPNGTYRVFSSNGGWNQGASGVVDTTANYIRGGSLI